MKDDMPNIDLSGIEQLQKVREEQDVVKERISKMQERKDKVSQAVFEKVAHDYDARLKDLEADAEPLQNAVRAEYRKLRAMKAELDTVFQEVSLEKEELTFRHELGELTGPDYEEKLKACEAKLAAQQVELEEAEQMRERFLSVFESPEDLEADDQPASKAAPPIEQPPVLEDDADDIQVEDAVDDVDDFETPEPAPDEEDEPPSLAVPEPPAPPELDDYEDALSADDYNEDAYEEAIPEDDDDDLEEDAPPLEDDDVQDLVSDLDESELDDDDVPPPPPPIDTPTPISTPAPPPLPSDSIETMPGENQIMSERMDAPMPPPVPPEPATMKLDRSQLGWDQPEDDGDGTMIISHPKLVILNGSSEGQEIALGMGTTSIGRSPENDIQIPEDRVSRKHAQVAFGPGGYALYDLNSENGTYINGTRVREHFLQDGDQILIGTCKLSYNDR